MHHCVPSPAYRSSLPCLSLCSLASFLAVPAAAAVPGGAAPDAQARKGERRLVQLLILKEVRVQQRTAMQLCKRLLSSENVPTSVMPAGAAGGDRPGQRPAAAPGVGPGTGGHPGPHF